MTVAPDMRKQPMPLAEERLRDEVAVAIARLRFAMIKWAAALAPGGIKKSRDIQKLFGIDAKLSWQVYRIINSDDPLELSPHIPSPAVMQTLMAAARKNATDEEALSKIAAAYAQFESLVNAYAEDRATFDSMMARLIGGDADALVELNHRKAMFEGQRYVLGYEADATVTTHIIHPSATRPGQADRIYLHAKENLRRYSSTASIVVNKRKTLNGEGQVPALEERPLDLDTFEKLGISFMPEFSSASKMPLCQRNLDDGTEITELPASDVGRSSAASLVFGTVRREVLSVTAAGGREYAFGSTMSSPLKTGVWDVLIHRPTYGRVDFDVQRWANAKAFPEHVTNFEAEGMVKLLARDKMNLLSGGASTAHLPEMPNYEELLQYACGTQGWNLEEMDLYRLRIEYPLMNSFNVVMVKFPGSEKWSAVKGGNA